MKVVRLQRKENLEERFKELQTSGLIRYSHNGYKKWRWQYLENPFFLAQEPAAWICGLNGKIVGHLGAIPVQLKVGSKKFNAAWLVDFVTLPEFRRKGVGRALVEEVDKEFEVLLAVGGTDMSFNLFTKMGWSFLGHVPYCIKLWDLKLLIKERVRNVFVANSAIVVSGILLGILNLFTRCRRPKDIEVSRIDNFDEEVDTFWNRISSSFKFVVPRNRVYLSWKYDLQPGMEYVKFRAAHRGVLCGYIVVRCIKGNSGKDEGLIAEIITHPNDKDAQNALLSEALQYLKDQGCSMVRCFLTHKDMRGTLIRGGLLRYKAKMYFLIKDNISKLGEGVDLDNWYLSAGDSDTDR